MSFRHFLGLLTLFALLPPAVAAPPTWWATGNPPIITGMEANNRGPANIGQAKWMVTEALRTLDTAAPGIASQIRADLATSHPELLTVPSPKPVDWAGKQKAPLLLGQLKAMSTPFYTRLAATQPIWLASQRGANGTNSPGSILPWTSTTEDDVNKAVATIGQLKAVFSLQFQTLSVVSPDDSDQDGLPDLWETVHGLNPTDSADASLVFPGSSQSNLQAYYGGVQAAPNATLTNKDGDHAEDDMDADPNDSVVDWAPAAEAAYAVIEMEQVNFAGYPSPAQLNPLSYWTRTRASIGKGGTVLWQYPVKSTNAAEDEWDVRYRVWKNGVWSADITNQSTQFTSFSMSTSYASTIDTWNPSILTQIDIAVDCTASTPHAVCGDLILGLGDYGGSKSGLPVCYTDSDAAPPTAETRNDGYASTGAVHAATLWTLGAESITADPIDPPSRYKFMSLYYFGGSAPLVSAIPYRPVASPGGALAILGTQTTVGVGLWKIWDSPDNGGSHVPGQGNPTVIAAGAWPHDDMLLIRAIEDGGVVVGERYSAGTNGELRHQIANDHGSESVLPGSEGTTHSALAICRVPTGVSEQSRLVAAGTDLWVQKNGQWSTAAYKPSANTIIAVAKNGVLLGTQAIWRNGKEISLDSLVASQKVAGPDSAARYTKLVGYAMNGEGAIVALADDALHPGSGKKTLLTLLPVDITVRKESETDTPSDGLCVIKGESITFDFNGPAPSESFPLPLSSINWQTRQVKQNGDFTNWISRGYSCEYTESWELPGIFQLKAVLTLPDGSKQEFMCVRKMDARHADNAEGDVQPVHKSGSPDYFGVTDLAWQSELRQHVVNSLGDTEYAKTATVPVNSFGFTINGNSVLTFGPGSDKCNLFVYHKANDIRSAPLVNLIRGTLNTSPPLAIDWWNDNSGRTDSHSRVINTVVIPEWNRLPDNEYPQPGFVTSRPQLDSEPENYHSHCGILDYDGSWIGAGSFKVNKYCHILTPFYQPIGLKK